MGGATKQDGRRRVVRPRLSADWHERCLGARIRMTRRVSAELASLQGLFWRYGKRETLADLWETVCMPALREYARPYAARAKADREARKAGRREG